MGKNILKATAELVNRRAKYLCRAGGQPPVTVDYIPPFGDGEGYTSLELLLLSLASCYATSVKGILTASMQKEVSALKVGINGTRREQHPTGFREINIYLDIQSDSVSCDDMDAAIRLSEDTVCPVYSMLKGSTEIMVEYGINRSRNNG